MTTAIFGKPETAGVIIGVSAEQMEQATIVYRAIHTLEVLRDHGIIQDDESVAALFVEQSWRDLRHLLEQYKAAGVRVNDIDLGEYFI